MRFAKQKFLIGIGLFSIPLVLAMAVLQNPNVSSFALQFSLRVARFRTGLKVNASSWNVNPISFSAALRDVEFSTGSVKISAPQVSVQLSPLALLLGDLGLHDVRIYQPLLSGSIPEELLKGNNEKTDWSKIDVVSLAAEKLSLFEALLRKRNLAFDQLHIIAARIEMQNAALREGNLRFYKLQEGQARLEWEFKEFEIKNYLPPVRSAQGSLALLKQARKNFILALRRMKIELGTTAANEVHADGRWPGYLDVQTKLTLAELNSWAKKSRWFADLVSSSKVLGVIDLDLSMRGEKSRLSDIGGEVHVSNLYLDEYELSSFSTKFESKNLKDWRMNSLHASLPTGLGDKLNLRNRIEIEELRVNDNKISGSASFHDVGVCSLLRAASVPECYAAFFANGNVALSGELSPFKLVARPQLKVSPGRVGTEPLKNRSDEELLYFNGAEVGGSVEIGEKEARITEAKIQWPNSGPIIGAGTIVYKPALVSLVASSENVNIESALQSFLNLRLQGKGKISAKINYSLLIPPEKGRTRVLSNFQFEGAGFEKQNLGNLNGDVRYEGNQLYLGPAVLRNGGGYAEINGQISPDPTYGPKMTLNVLAKRLETRMVAPESGSEIVHAYINGNTQLSGYLNTQKGGPSLQGELQVNADNLKVFGIPLLSATGTGYYENKILKIHRVVGRKELSTVTMTGILNPAGGSELLFSTQNAPIKSIGYMPELERIFERGVCDLEGYWRPSKGWGIDLNLKDLFVAGRDLNSGRLLISGTNNQFTIDLSLPGQLGLLYLADPNVTPMRPHKLKYYSKDSGVLASMAYLKGWTGSVPVETRGEINLNWEGESGSLAMKNFSISANSGSNNVRSSLFSIEKEWRFGWKGNEITQNTATSPVYTSNRQKFIVFGEPGNNTARLEGKIPMALLDLFLPGGFRLQDGEISLAATVPMPPHINSVRARGDLKDAIVHVQGVGRPLSEGRAELNLSQSRLGFKNGVANLGQGQAQFQGDYLIDLKKPGVVLDLTLDRAQVVLLDDVPMDLSGQLSMRGDGYPYLMAGKVVASNGIYSKEFKTEKSPAPSDRVNPILRYNIDVEVGSRFMVRNSIASTQVNGRLVLAGTDLAPAVSGQLEFNRGSIYAKDSEFSITQGRLNFLEDPTLAPVLALRANTNSPYLNQNYRIEMSARGPANDLTIEFTSDPPLPPQDIVNLLAFGSLRENSETTATTSTSLGARGYVEAAQYEAFQALFGEALGKSLNKSTGFSVKVGSAADLAQKSTIPKVTVQRKLSKKLTATFGRSLDTSKPERNVQVEYRLLNNVNLTGVWESPKPEESSSGVDLRFRFDIK